MKSIFSAFVSTLIITFMAVICTLIISTEIQTATARNFLNNTIDEIQASYYSEEVMNNCIEEADKIGFLLVIEEVSIYEDKKDVKVSLTYTLPGVFLGEARTTTISGYAR